MKKRLSLKLRRIEKGFKLYELADKLGISPQYLSMIESGEAKNPSSELMIKASNVLDSSIDNLFFNKK